MAMAQQLENSSESTSLLLNTDSLLQRIQVHVCPLSQKPLCLPSKAAILILFWTAVVGMMYCAAISLIAVAFVIHPYDNNNLSVHQALSYAILAFITMFYPLSGFIADVCCGRLKTVVVSLILLLISLISFLLGILLWATLHLHVKDIGHGQGVLVIILAALFLLTFIIGLAGYQANFIQLGLDQLFEAPSQYLGLFIHYATLAFYSGSLPILTVISLTLCNKQYPAKYLHISLLFVMLLSLIVLLLIGCWRRRWFHSEPGWNNPYKTVYDIISFVKNHKHPLRRSAFTYGDRYIPSRLDFAKERYGGPFTTEQVENVKTFMRILLILFAMGPAYALEVPASLFVFPLFGLHSLHYYKQYWLQSCTKEFMWEILMESGSMMNILTTVILFPIYIWVVFSLLRKKVPKLFLRLGFGIVICLLGVMSLLIIDVVGHSMNKIDDNNQTQCVFQGSLTNSVPFPALNLHWTVLILPNLCLGVGPLLVVATTFEFISAQSPQSMKGFLVGVFFVIRGLFQFLNSITIIPLSLKNPWASGKLLEHPPVTNCGFVYLLLTCVSGLIGLILFSVAAKRYKYRKRDEGMFRQQDVEEIYDRYLTQGAVDSLQDVSSRPD